MYTYRATEPNAPKIHHSKIHTGKIDMGAKDNSYVEPQEMRR